MKKITIIFLLIILSKSAFSQIHAGISYKPPLLPFSIHWGTNGFSIRAESSINTPLGEFGIEAGTNLSKGSNDKYPVTSKTIYVKVPEYTDRVVYKDRIKYKDRIIEKPIVKIKTIEKLIEKKIYEYEVIIKNIKSNDSCSFLISGLDALIIEGDGKFQLKAETGKLTVELLESKLTSLQFRGGNLVKDDLSDLIVKLCQKYNQEYQLKVKQNKNGDGTKRSIHSEGFLLYGKYQVEEYPETFEKIRDLRDNYKIKDFNNKTVALLEDNLFTQNGIGFKISVEEKVYCDKFFRKNVECGEKEYDLYEFKYWNDILKLNISDKGNDWNSYFVYSYDVKKYFNNRRFKNVEMQQFFIELQNLIYSEIK